jgi:hypothetical protein
MSKIELLNKLLELTVWLPIKDYPNYEVSICGQVRNVTTKRILKPGIRGNGYYFVVLCNKNSIKSHSIHRLVAKAFIPNIFNKEFVDHINNQKLDNTVSNLRWCTNQQNQFNSLLSKRNTSGIRGVTWEKNKWRARLEYNGKKIHLGYFDDINDAKLARQLKAKELFKEFLNECEK